VFEEVERLLLEESDSVITVMAYATRDTGGYFVADSREAKVRRYDRAGRLVWQRGRRGAGPGEYQDPRFIVRMESGRVVSGQSSGRVHVYDSDADSLLASFHVPLTRVTDAVRGGGDRIIVAGIPGSDFELPRLHLISLDDGSVEASFFSPFAQTPSRDAAIIGGFVRLDDHEGAVVSTWSLSDSIYIWQTRDDSVLIAYPLNSSHFRTLGAEAPGSSAGREAQQEWLASFDYISDVAWIAPNTVLIQYFTLNSSDTSRDWHLVIGDLLDNRRVDVRHTPEFLWADPRDGTAAFAVDPLNPGTWSIVRLREDW
jgi:hypothetical protein